MDYNPHSPHVIGMEWAPVRQADYTPDTVTERGYVVRLDTSITPVSGHIGVADLPSSQLNNVVEFISIYPELHAGDSGPIRSVVVPAMAISITGAQVTSTTGDYTALTVPTDNAYIEFTSSAQALTDAIGINFNTSAVNAQLSGKRIVDVRLIYTAMAVSGVSALAQIDVSIIRSVNRASKFTYQNGLEGAVGDFAFVTNFGHVDFTELNPFWAANTDELNGSAIYPWLGTTLFDFDTATNVYRVMLTGTLNGLGLGAVRVGYCALEIFYCEEQRVLHGGRRIMTAGFPQNQFVKGLNLVQLRNTALALGSTSIGPGNYVVVASRRSLGNQPATTGAPVHAAIREPNTLQPVVGRTITETTTVGDDFTLEEDFVIPDIGIYTSGSLATASHTYGAQVAAGVFSNSVYARQVVAPRGSVATSVPFTQVRFYARRFSGANTIPLKVGLANSATQVATITPDELDALPEVIDGWKEVTLTLGAPILVTGGANFNIDWNALGAPIGGQYQILGAAALVPLGANPASNTAGYDPPNGATVNAQWNATSATATATDAQADLTVMLAQDAPLVTGFVVGTGSQALTGVATECGVPAGCVPSAIGYNTLSWSALAVCDDFERAAVTGSYGVAPTGQPWTLSGGTVGIDYYLTGHEAVMSLGSVGVFRYATIDVGATDQYARAESTITVFPFVGSVIHKVTARFTDGSNYYFAQLDFQPGGTLLVNLLIGKFVGGVFTQLATVIGFDSFTVGDKFTTEIRVVGSTIMARAWKITPPSSWMLTVTDTSLTTSTRVGFGAALNAGNTNPLPVLVNWDNFYAVAANLWEGGIEVQRSDDLTDWQTVLKTADLCSLSFADYEARVGMQSRYRVRSVDALGFAGPWVTGAATLPSPGVTTTGSGNSVLIFTSNQAPNSSLAYPMSWQGNPVETFVFPEADTQVFQRMYGRDFQVAFRPLERGGETFDRVILVQAAAIAVPSLADFKGLRDLAWDDLPYVCVRDELGNRWFANVLVPAGETKRNRRLYLAQIRVTEVADEAAPVT
jgi:hypothetical protein